MTIEVVIESVKRAVPALILFMLWAGAAATSSRNASAQEAPREGTADLDQSQSIINSADKRWNALMGERSVHLDGSLLCGNAGMARYMAFPYKDSSISVVRNYRSASYFPFLFAGQSYEQICLPVGISIVPYHVRFGSISAKDFIYAVATYNSLRVGWSFDGRHAILFRQVNAKTVAQCKRDLKSPDIDTRIEAAIMGRWLDDPEIILALLNAVHDTSVLVSDRALRSLTGLDWVRVVHLVGPKALPALKKYLYSPFDFPLGNVLSGLAVMPGIDAERELNGLAQNGTYYNEAMEEPPTYITRERSRFLKSLRVKYGNVPTRVFEYSYYTKIKSGDVIHFLKAGLRDSSSRVRAAVSKQLMLYAAKHSKLKTASSLLEKPGKDPRGAAIKALRPVGGTELMPLLDAWLTRQAKACSLSVVGSLARHGNPEAMAAIKTLLQHDDPEVRKKTARAYIEFLPNLDHQVFKLLTNPDREDIRNALMKHLTEPRNQSALNHFLSSDRDPNVRSSAIYASGEGSHSEGPTIAIEALNDSHKFVRDAAMYGIDDAPIKQRFQLYQTVLKKRRFGVKENAAMGLARIGDQASRLIVQAEFIKVSKGLRKADSLKNSLSSLALCGGNEGLDVIAEYLKRTKRPILIADVAHFLPAFGLPQSVDLFKKIFMKKYLPSERYPIYQSTLMLRNPNVLNIFGGLFDSTSKKARLESLRILVHCTGERSIPYLEKAFLSEDKHTRGQVLSYAGKIEGMQITPLILKGLGDKELSVRTLAAEQLQVVAGPFAKQAFLMALQGPDPKIQLSAAKAYINRTPHVAVALYLNVLRNKNAMLQNIFRNAKSKMNADELSKKALRYLKERSLSGEHLKIFLAKPIHRYLIELLNNANEDVIKDVYWCSLFTLRSTRNASKEVRTEIKAKDIVFPKSGALTLEEASMRIQLGTLLRQGLSDQDERVQENSACAVVEAGGKPVARYIAKVLDINLVFEGINENFKNALKTDERFTTILTELKKADSEERSAYNFKLNGLKRHQKVTILKVAIKDRQESIRAIAAAALRPSLGNWTLQSLRLAFADPSNEVHRGACASLEYFTNPSVLPLIEKAFLDSSGIMDSNAGRAMWRWPKEIVLGIMERAMKVKSAQLCDYVLENLKRCSEEDAYKLFEKIMAGSNSFARASVFRHLWAVEKSKRHPLLLKGWHDKSELVRAIVVEVIGRERHTYFYPQLMNAHQDPAQLVREAAIKSLLIIGGEDAGAYLCDIIRSGTKEDRENLIAQMRTVHQENRHLLVREALKQKDPRFRIKALEALVYFTPMNQIGSFTPINPFARSSQDVIPNSAGIRRILKTTLSDPNILVRLAAAKYFEYREPTLDVIKVMLGMRDIRIRRIGAKLFSKSPFEDSIEILQKGINDVDPKIRAHVMRAIPYFSLKPVLRALNRMYNSTTPAVRARSMDCLRYIKDWNEQVICLLEKGISDPSKYVRAQAALALDFERDPRCVKWVQKLIAEDANSVRFSAIAMLKKQGGKKAKQILLARLQVEPARNVFYEIMSVLRNNYTKDIELMRTIKSIPAPTIRPKPDSKMLKGDDELEDF